MTKAPLGWLGILRLGLVQTALGAIVVLATSTLNRVMVVEMMLPAMLPGALVGLHYAVQVTRPRFGYGSDVGGRRTPWIIGGMAVLALGSIAAAIGTGLMATSPLSGIILATLAFVLIGAGVGSAGTTLLVLLAQRVAAEKRAAAASIVWIMMIAGFAVTAGTAGHFLDPFSTARLVGVTAAVAGIAVVVTLLAVARVEDRPEPASAAVDAAAAPPPGSFKRAMAEVWAEPAARRFAVFVFVSMLAYSAQDLILEPFAGLVFAYTPGESTKLAGVQHGGVLLGMILVGIVGSARFAGRLGSLRHWTVGGCIGSAAALFALALSGFIGPAWPLRTTVFLLGIANGAFAVAAIGSMMTLVAQGRERREGVRMGLWGAAQAIAFGLGGFLGTAAIDLTRHLMGSPVTAYATVFIGEGLLFLVAAGLALQVGAAPARRRAPAEVAAIVPSPAPLGR